MTKMNGILNEKRPLRGVEARGGIGMRDPHPLRNKNSETDNWFKIAWSYVEGTMETEKICYWDNLERWKELGLKIKFHENSESKNG